MLCCRRALSRLQKRCFQSGLGSVTEAGLFCLPFWSGIVLGKKKDFLRALTFQEEAKKQELNRGLQNSTVVKSLGSNMESPITSCMPSGKLFNLSDPTFPLVLAHGKY